MIELVATTSAGMEAVVAQELTGLGRAQPTVRPGKVTFPAEWHDVARLNLELRSADRLKLRMGGFPARTFDALFEGTRALPWVDLLPSDAAFPVIGRSARSALHSVPDCQAIVKKAVVEAMRGRYGARHWFTEDGPLYRIEVEVHDDQVELTVDTSGDGLHRRGYRRLVSAAPLRENLAAGLLLLMRWRPGDEVLVDPFCGSGTIAIEAALIARRQAPGLRRRFASMAWPQLGAAAWREATRRAEDAIDPSHGARILASDVDAGLVDVSRRNARAAGVAADIELAQGDVRELRAPDGRGIFVGNPPYGQRLGEDDDLLALIRDLGEVHRRAGPSWRAAWLSAMPGFESAYGRPADRRRKLYNAGIAAQLYQYRAP